MCLCLYRLAMEVGVPENRVIFNRPMCDRRLSGFSAHCRDFHSIEVNVDLRERIDLGNLAVALDIERFVPLAQLLDELFEAERIDELAVVVRVEIPAVGVNFRRRELFLVAAAHGCEELVAALCDFHLAVRDVVLCVAELAPQLLDELLAVAQRFLRREDGRKRRLLAVEVYGMDVRRVVGDAVVCTVDGCGEVVEVADEREDAVVAAANVPLDIGDGRPLDFAGRADSMKTPVSISFVMRAFVVLRCASAR